MQRKNYTIHLVAPSEYQVFKDNIENIDKDLQGQEINLKVINWDYSFNSLAYWSESENKVEPDILLIFDNAEYNKIDPTNNENIGYKNIIDNLKKTKFNISDKTKIIMVLSKEKEKDISFINELIKLEIYNIQFVDAKFTIDELLFWFFEDNKTLRDYKDFLNTENLDTLQEQTDTNKIKYQPYQEPITDTEKIEETNKKPKSLDTIKTLAKDMFSKTHEHAPTDYKVIKKTQTMIKQEILGTIIIGVANVIKSSGCSHLSLSIANYLTNKGYKTALVEINSEPCFKYIVNDKNAILSDNKPYIKYNNIDIYYQDKTNNYNIQNLFKNINISNYKYVVIDLGLLKKVNQNDSMQPIENYYEMWRTNYQILCLSGSPWKWGAINYYRHDDFAEVEPNIENWNLVVNFTNKTNFLKIKKEIKNITMLNKVYNMPMFSDVFSKNENVTTFLDNLLKDIIPISQPTKTLLNINPFKLLNNNE